jgi:hypothetical protein
MSTTSVPRAPGADWGRLAPAALTTAGVAVAGWRGFTDPIAWLVLAPGALWLFTQLLSVLPVAAFWLVPIGMCWFTYLPLLHYEALTLALGAAMVLSALAAGRLRTIRLQPVEWRYALFLLVMLPGLPAAVSLWRFGGAVKLYLVGIAGFAVARHASARWGRRAMLLGPVAFVLITVAQLTWRVASSGVPAFKSLVLRTYLTALTWGTSNYVAAVLVLCMPAMVLFVQESPRRSRLRGFALAGLVATLASMFFTLSRGGFLLCVLYLLSLTGALRRSRAPLLALFAGLAALLAFSPLGRMAMDRFTSTAQLSSIWARTRIWQAAWERAITHLPFGVGTGQGWLQQDKLQYWDPHCFPLTLLGEMGPLGLLAWSWVIAALWAAAGRLAREPATRAAGGAMRATIVLGVANSLFEPTLIGNLYHLLFWWLLGIFHGAGPPVDLPAGASREATAAG